MIDTPKFKSLLKETFAPFLRSHGFIGSGFNFRKITKERYIYALTIQANKYGGSCRVHLGVHLDFLPNSIGEMMPANKVVVYACHLRKILTYEGAKDYWWEYGHTEEEALVSINSMMEMFTQYGLPYFNKFTGFPEPLTSITISDIEEDTLKVRQLGSLTEVGMALLLARVYFFIENKEQAKKFAEWGLRILKNVKKDSPTVPIFEKIIEGSSK